MPKAAKSRKRAKRDPQPSDPPSLGLLPDEVLSENNSLEAVLKDAGVLNGDSLLKSFPDRSDTYLRTLGKRVNELGGWLAVTGKQLWDTVETLEGRNPRADYEAVWFPVLKWHDFERKYGSDRPYGLSPALLHPQSIVPIPILTPPASGRLSPSFWDSLFAMDIVILRGFLTEVWRVDSGLFSIEQLDRTSPAQTISLQRQSRVPGGAAQSYSQKAVLSEFLRTVRSEAETRTPSDPTAACSTSLDIGGWKDQVNELLSKLPAALCFGSDCDALAYARNHLSGVTLPVATVSTGGCWRGVAQGEGGLWAVDANWGAGTQEWWAVRREEWEMGKLEGRADGWRVTEDGRTWPDEHYLMKRGDRVYYGQQLPGDLVLVSPSLYRWSKALAPHTACGWAVCPKTLAQFTACFACDAANRSSSSESPVQIYTLAMDLVNSEMETLPVDLLGFIGEKLGNRFEEEAALAEKWRLVSVGVIPGHQVRRCV